MACTFTLRFSSTRTGAYRLLRTDFRCGGVVQKCVSSAAAEPGEEYTFRESTSEERKDAPGHLVFALAMVRIAQWKYIKPIRRPDSVILFRSETDKGIASRFMRFIFDAKSRKSTDKHACLWLQKMVWLPDEKNDVAARGRLNSWFSCKTSPSPREVSCNSKELPPESVQVFVDGQEADERILDLLEISLAFQADAGFPFHFEGDGLLLIGRPPSVRPEFYGREEQSHQLTNFKESIGTRIVSIEGVSTAGKTHLVMHWVRRLVGLQQLHTNVVIFWSFAGQASAGSARVPTDQFFTDLADAFGILVSRDSSKTVDDVMAVLKHKKPLFVLDGLEATIRTREHASRGQTIKTPRFEVDKATRKLLAAISEGDCGFAVITSRVSVSAAYQCKTSVIELPQAPIDPSDKINGEYLSDPELLRQEEEEARRTLFHQNILATVSKFLRDGIGMSEL